MESALSVLRRMVRTAVVLYTVGTAVVLYTVGTAVAATVTRGSNSSPGSAGGLLGFGLYWGRGRGWGWGQGSS